MDPLTDDLIIDAPPLAIHYAYHYGIPLTLIPTPVAEPTPIRPGPMYVPDAWVTAA